MRLYLYAESKNNVGYIPDWLKIKYGENGERLELTLDVQASIDYSDDELNCRCKGDLVPWSLWNYGTGEEIDLDLMSKAELEKIMPNEKIVEIICKSDNYVVGIYPVDDSEETFELVKGDRLHRCEGLLEMYIDEKHFIEKRFEFEAELNFC